MLTRLITIAVLAIGATIVAQPVRAGLMYDFSYDFNLTESIIGELTGDLQGDSDTIHVTDVFAEITTPSGPFTVDTDGPYFVDRDSGFLHDTFGIVSLSGLTMDFILHTGTHGGSCFNVDSVCLGGPGSFAFVGGRNVGYIADNWSISRSVPEPGTLALLGFGLLGLGFARKLNRAS